MYIRERIRSFYANILNSVQIILFILYKWTDPLKVTLLGAGMERNLLLARRQEWKYSRAALDTKDSPWVSKIR
jgi:hypothetical protein